MKKIYYILANSKTKRQIEPFIFCILFCAIFNICQTILTPYWKYITNVSEGESDRINAFYSQAPNSLDYLVLGVSHSFYSVNPMQPSA